MKISLIRHGQSQANVEGIYASIDTPLTNLGQESLKFLAQKPPQGDLYVSPAKRAIQTAEGIFSRPGKIEDRLLEISYGALEGLTFSQSQDSYPQEVKTWLENPFDNGPPQGESIKQLLDRVEDLLHSWIQKNHDVVAVTHEGVIRAFLALAVGKRESYFNFFIENASLSSLRVEGGFTQILQINYK